MKRYEAYKHSGVEWIGEIPEHWECKRLGALLTVFSSKNHTDKPLLSITREKGVILRDLDDETENHNFIPDDLSGYKLIKEGQFGMNKMKAWQGSYGISDYDGIVSPAYFIFNVSEEIYPNFFHLAIRSKFYVAHFGSASDGVRIGQWDLSKPRMREIPFFIPPLPEQTAIAEFLDDKTAKIDQLIGIKQKEIELLKERRQILIQQAVTKGLDDTVKMKDSGVDWIGEIPEHWEVRKLKYIGNMFSGLTNKKGDDFSREPKEGFAPFIPFTNIFRNNKISENEFQFVKSNVYDVQNVVEFNDILFLMSSETYDDIGKNSIYLGKSRVYLNSFCKGFKIFNKNVNPLFINFLLLSKNYREYFASVGRGFTRINIKQEYVLDMPILYFPISEQTQIVTYLEEVEEKIAKAISLKQQEIEKLKEYKMVLINNGVTGK